MGRLASRIWLGSLLRSLRVGGVLIVVAACGKTVDSLGYDTDDTDAGVEGDKGASDVGGAGSGGIAGDAKVSTLRPVAGPSSYPNAFRQLLGKSDDEIQGRIKAAFEQLFHGDPANEAIYFRVGEDQAYIQDILHGDVRTEGIGFGMMIAVQLNRREEFDRLWAYAQSAMQYRSGANRGYFRSSCDQANGSPEACADPFGHQQMLTALLFAEGRWGGQTGDQSYGAQAQALLDIMRRKEEQNGGAEDGVTNMFDPSHKLPYGVPHTSAAEYSRPSIVMPAYYELWAQATGDSFWSEAAESARAYWQRTANPTTGFMPARAEFGGKPVPDWDTFQPEGYRFQLNLVLDHIWFRKDPWEVEESDRLLNFFHDRGMTDYGSSYTLDGATVLESSHDTELIAMNGATALSAQMDQRAAFVEAVWDIEETPSGSSRYYAGMLYLLSLLVLSGEYQVY
ncbi:glycosyl hydrolase family 8 [Myxococcota bacterium]